MPNRERRIRLAEGDILRIKRQVENTSFYQKAKKDTEPYKYEMMKKEGSCIFLVGNRCTVYENRPLVCQFYPFAMIELDGYLFDVDRACRGVGTGEVLHKGTLKRLVLEAQRALM